MGGRRNDGARRSTAVVLFVVSLVVYLANARVGASGDSRPARVLPFSILREGDLDLDEFPWLRAAGYSHYYLYEKDGRFWSAYPVLPGLLAVPVALPVLQWLKVRGGSDDSVTFRLAVALVERIAAALIAAASVGLLYLAARRVAPAPAALVASLTYAFGTNTWAISSQALWQHGPAELFLCALSLALLGPPAKRDALLAGSSAALAVAARPTMVVFAIAALVFLWRERRRELPFFLIVPLIAGALLLAYNLAVFGRPSGGYGGEKLALPSLGRLAGLLVSPSRGLLVYTPAAVLSLAVIPIRRQGWLSYLAWASAVYLGLLSFYVNWWAGQCWGPRYLTDMLPALALLAGAGAERWWDRRAVRLAGALLVLWGVAVQAIGVYWYDRAWDQLPVAVGQRPERVWEWSDPQIVRALQGEWKGGEVAPLLWQTLAQEVPATVRPLSETELGGAVSLVGAAPERLPAGGRERVRLLVRNGGAAPWPAFSGTGALHVGILQRWWCAGVVEAASTTYTALPRNVAAGRSDSFALTLTVPRRPGSCEVELRVLQLVTPDTGRTGSAALRLAVEVESGSS